MSETMTPERRVARPGLRFLLLVPLAAVAFVLLVDSFRDVEASIANVVLGPFGGGTRSGGLLILRVDELSSVGLRVGRSCSALTILLGCAVAALGLLRARPSRRGLALLVGAAAGLLANTLRIVAPGAGRPLQLHRHDGPGPRLGRHHLHDRGHRRVHRRGAVGRQPVVPGSLVSGLGEMMRVANTSGPVGTSAPAPPRAATTPPSPQQHPTDAPTGALEQLDDDPFARLTDADLKRLRHDPLELAEELRFGSYWLDRGTSGTTRVHSQALEIAAVVIEELVARDQGETEEPSTGMRAHPARPAAPTYGLPAAAPVPAPASSPRATRPRATGSTATGRRLRVVGEAPAGNEVVEVIEAQLAAYTEYAERLSRYLDDLRSLLPTDRVEGAP